MANRPKGYGLSAQIYRKQQESYSIRDEQEALCWMEVLIGEGDVFLEVEGMKKTAEALKDGVYLCNLMDVLYPGSIPKIHQPTGAFLKMENIDFFLKACRKYGLKSTDLFQTSDLYDETNIGAVINTIHAVGRKAQTNGFTGAILGPKESEKNKREFSEDQMAAGKQVIGLQMGSSKGANQAGMNFGKNRFIID